MRHTALLTLLVLVGCGTVDTTNTDASDIDAVATVDAPSAIDAVVTVDAPSAIDASTVDAAAGCNADEVCVGTTPANWSGPVAVGEGSSCSDAYPTSQELVNSGLNAAAATCGCGCFVNSVVCQLRANGNLFTPVGSCHSPPIDDSCLTATVASSCTTNPSTNVPTATWTDTARVCVGATAGGSCTAGTCFDNADGFGDVCIIRDGDHACPLGTFYTERTLYHRDFTDTRGCSTCSCTTSGQGCQIELEICSMSFEDVTLQSGGSSYCLNSGDGDGVTLMSTSITSSGTCSTSGGSTTGAATAIDPVTVCCLP